MFQKNALLAIKKTYHQFVAIGVNQENGQIEVKVRFKFPRLLQDKIDQYLFLSDDFTKLLEVHTETACLFDLVPKSSDNDAKVNVIFKGRIPRLPIGLCDSDVLQLYSLFSPDLSRHIDMNPNDQTWIVREAITGRVVFKIPPSFLTYNSSKPKQII